MASSGGGGRSRGPHFNFASDPAYQAALEAATNSAVIAASTAVSGQQPPGNRGTTPGATTPGAKPPAPAPAPPVPPPPPPATARKSPSASPAGGVSPALGSSPNPSGSGFRFGFNPGSSGGGGGAAAAAPAAGPPSGAVARADSTPQPAAYLARAASAAEPSSSRGVSDFPLAGISGPAAMGSGSGSRGSATPLQQQQQPGSSSNPGAAPAPAARTPSGGKAGARTIQLGRYPEHLDQEALQRAVKKGCVFRGKLRVNASDRREAYVTLPGLASDLLLRGDLAQNRAIEGDEVAVAVLPTTEWYTVHRLAAQQQQQQSAEALANRVSSLELLGASGGGAASSAEPWLSAGTSPEAVLAAVAKLAAARPELRVTGKVVAVLTPSVKRERVVGVLQRGEPGSGAPPADAAAAAAGPAPPALFLLPLDPRLPRCVVRSMDVKGLAEELLQEAADPSLDKRTLMSARIVEWSSSYAHPAVSLRHSLGQAGEIESETAALLEMEGVRCGEFSPEVLACLPPTPWSVEEQDLSSRRDFRNTRIFSIDPPTAKDLDDALSIEPLQGGNWRVGVHIADVAHFIPPYSALDKEAGLRATSVYLVQRVVPMLPSLLCEELCSLNPGVTRFAFSVVWDLDQQGRILSQWAGRSVIRSCAKLSYPVVQTMIEGTFDAASCPVQLHGDATWEQVVTDSLALWGIASQLRAARFAGGALRLDNVRLSFKLDKDANPVAGAPYVQAEANQLVEEFMLLANMSVAKLIAETFAERAMLRNHPPPNESKLKAFKDATVAAGQPVDTSTAASLQAGLQALRQSAAAAAASSSPEAAARRRRVLDCLIMMATRPMQLATYFCTGTAVDARAWRHYALAVEAYTHFTSPIRRYPDVVVHRLLAAALELRASPSASVDEVMSRHQLFNSELCEMVAKHCNEKRLAARNVQDGSLHLFLCVMLRRQPVVTTAVVTNVGGDRYFYAYLSEYGHEVRIEVKDMGVPLSAYWDDGAKALLLSRASPAQQGGSGTGAGATPERQNSRGGGGTPGGRGGGGGRGGFGRSGSQQRQEETDCPDLAAWVANLPPLRNAGGLQPASLPLQIKLFSELPVVLTSVMVAGKPSELLAKPFLEQAAAAVAAAAAAAPAALAAAAPAAAAVRESAIPLDTLLND